MKNKKKKSPRAMTYHKARVFSLLWCCFFLPPVSPFVSFCSCNLFVFNFSSFVSPFSYILSFKSDHVPFRLSFRDRTSCHRDLLGPATERKRPGNPHIICCCSYCCCCCFLGRYYYCSNFFHCGAR